MNLEQKEMVIQRPGPGAFAVVRDFYWDMIDQMKASSAYRPKWEKGVNPSDELLKTALDHGELVVCKSNDRIIGAMVLNHRCNEGYAQVTWGTQAEEQEVTIVHALGVSPKHQRQSVAESMVQYAIGCARETNQKAIRLDVLHDNVPARKLYEKQGFVYRGTVPLEYPDTGRMEFHLYEYPVDAQAGKDGDFSAP